jgi:hypothetical protein
MARSKSTTGEKTTRSRVKTKREDQLGDAGIPGAPDVNATAAHTGSETQAEHVASPQVAAESIIAPETRPSHIVQESNSPEPRKLGVVKTEPRKHVVVPINLDDEIRRRAYELYEQRGSTPGNEADDWLTAEREVRERYQRQQQSA